ncbi:MAG: glycosyltransferase family 2 protein [Bacteroidota bacterium]|jgi:glycosyltransferase involved in cell wall biosynthesis|nr:MAG: glycosyl transferase [Bacteroidota bacterium]
MDKVSIITVCFNSGETIADTVDSVLSQDYKNVEYIVVDGASTDNTMDILRSYGDRIHKLVSEKDNGLYDAMNKAIDLSTGDVIGILNSDDIYDNEKVLSRVMHEFATKNVDSVFGDLYYFKPNKPEKPIRHFRGRYFRPGMIRMGILPPHPTFFVRREVYDKYGKFDLRYKYAADFDLMARLLYVHRISYSYLPLNLVRMRIGGISTGSWRRIIEINNEDLKSCREHGIPTNAFMLHMKYLLKMFGIRDIVALLSH